MIGVPETTLTVQTMVAMTLQIHANRHVFSPMVIQKQMLIQRKKRSMQIPKLSSGMARRSKSIAKITKELFVPKRDGTTDHFVGCFDEHGQRVEMQK